MIPDTQNKIVILLPDGVGLRTFAYTKLPQLATDGSCDLIFWNNTAMSLSSLGLNEVIFSGSRLHPLTDLYKNARKEIELNLFSGRFKDNVYDTYRFPLKARNFKSGMRILFTKYLITRFGSDTGLAKIRSRIHQLERSTEAYKKSVDFLKTNKPDLLFCSNQRHSSAIAPILAARDLGIKTATFIFSWDNLPKATMVLECDYYFVWSGLMKKQLLEYYPYISEEQIVVCGTTQFESHYDENEMLSKEVFFRLNNLDASKEYVCYSGDDITTSPDDPSYLRDTALAIEKLNLQGYQLGILFRRCPVDFSSRYDDVLNEFSHLITAVDPIWEARGESWQSVVAMPEDSKLLANTARHTFGAINLGSSMVFDFAAHQKPCAYINYNHPERSDKSWDIDKIYKYVHFRSMPSKESVIWLDSPESIAGAILQMLENPKPTIDHATQWFEKITLMPANSASERIFKAMQEIITGA
ncbi:UDP-glycosyltransferase [Flavobacterium silvaticum]|uniref:UDP-glycosyltransferase n=1 Tax=Flavobacterium silvaticum TaxID=1852020 RepID=A0A972G2V1_9FLAO|nr:UDP-glycosyltransferase [Flavobacterium silvaticum]NMH29481.1 UDP-glycosyltransferase [Flavobacterium silvaticum]